MEFALLTGLGLAAPAGLNAYIPLLVLALAARFSTAVTLASPFDVLSSTWAIVILLVLLTVELVVDKVPGLDNSVRHTVMCDACPKTRCSETTARSSAAGRSCSPACWRCASLDMATGC